MSARYKMVVHGYENLKLNSSDVEFESSTYLPCAEQVRIPEGIPKKLGSCFTMSPAMSCIIDDLSKETGMPITQFYGQRFCGPPSNYDGEVPRKGSEVFVGKLPRDSFEPELIPIFANAGRIYQVRLMMDFSGTNRGYCFVKYFTPDEATHAIDILDGWEIRPGRRLGAARSIDNTRLYIRGFRRGMTKDEVWKELGETTHGILRLTFGNPGQQKSSKNRGHAVVEYVSHKDAALARRKLIPGVVKCRGKTLIADWATHCNDGQNLIVQNLSPSTTNIMLREIFNSYSDNGVDRVKKVKNFAFIHFQTLEQAKQVYDSVQNMEIDGAAVRVNWAKEKGKIDTGIVQSNKTCITIEHGNSILFPRRPPKQRGSNLRRKSEETAKMLAQCDGEGLETHNFTQQDSRISQPWIQDVPQSIIPVADDMTINNCVQCDLEIKRMLSIPMSLHSIRSGTQPGEVSTLGNFIGALDINATSDLYKWTETTYCYQQIPAQPCFCNNKVALY